MNRCKKILFTCYLTIAALALSAKNDIKVIDAEQLMAVQMLDMPLLQIETINQETPTADIVYSEQGLSALKNANKVSGQMIMTVHGDTIYNSGEYESKKSRLTVKVRGNSSSVSSLEYKPCYKLKLQKKKDLLFRIDKDYASKEWLLIKKNQLALDQHIQKIAMENRVPTIEDKEKRIFNIWGQPQSGMRRGLNIVVQPNGNVQKVLQ